MNFEYVGRWICNVLRGVPKGMTNFIESYHVSYPLSISLDTYDSLPGSMLDVFTRNAMRPGIVKPGFKQFW